MRETTSAFVGALSKNETAKSSVAKKETFRCVENIIVVVFGLYYSFRCSCNVWLEVEYSGYGIDVNMISELDLPKIF